MGSLRSLMRSERPEPVIMIKPSDAVLIEAVRSGTVGQVKALLERGANPNAEDRLGNALDFAFYRDDLQKAELLISYMTDVNQRGLLGLTALHQAASSSSNVALEVCVFLLDHGADVNAVDFEGWTPLMNAVHSKHFDIARLLLERGADASLEDWQGDRALDLLRRAKGYKALRKLLEQAS
jgi:uncharacterized protein